MFYLLANAKRFGYKIGIQFNKTPLFTDKKYYATKILNAYIVYHLEFCLFCATNVLKNSDKSNYLHSGFRKAFDVAGSYSFDNNFGWNVSIFPVDNNSSSHTDNCKNNFLVLGEKPTDDNNGCVGTSKKKFSINSTKTNRKFWLNLFYNDGSSYLFVNIKKSINLKPIIKL